jgi:uncharacterized protein YidB (DUF937 family)
MGLFDILTGRPDRMIPGGGLFGRGGGGMSPITMGVLGLLAYKAIQGINKPSGTPGPGAGGGLGGGIGDWLRKTFGGDGAPGSGNAGGILSGGLRDLVGQFQQSNHGDVAKSWVDTGANRAITPDMLAKVLTEEQIATLMAHTGLGREELLRGMSDELPHVVDKLTPEGRVPSPQEMDKVIDNKVA